MRFADVYRLTKKIPEGKVATYGDIARALGTTDARKVGWALHVNRDPQVPCHRVVAKNGRLAPNFAFNGAEEQRLRLKADGVVFTDDMHVDMKLCHNKKGFDDKKNRF